jgi:hypothetical protein
MAVAVPIQDLVAPPDLAAHGLSRILLSNRKFVIGATILVVVLVVCLVGGALVGAVAFRTRCSWASSRQLSARRWARC